VVNNYVTFDDVLKNPFSDKIDIKKKVKRKNKKGFSNL